MDYRGAPEVAGSDQRKVVAGYVRARQSRPPFVPDDARQIACSRRFCLRSAVATSFFVRMMSAEANENPPRARKVRDQMTSHL